MKRIAPIPWLLLALACLVVANTFTQRDAARAESTRLRRSLDSLATVTARIDTVYARDTLTLWRLARSTDTLTQTVHEWKFDTVKVVEYVQRADSTIRSCAAAVLTCEERVAARDATIQTWERRWDTRPNPPSKLAVWGERGVWLTLLILALK